MTEWNGLLNVGGVAFVLFCVFGMYVITGGALLPLLWAMPFGIITIGGASVGILAAGNSRHVIEQTFDDLKKVTVGSRFHKTDYVDQRWPALFEHRFAFYKWKLCRVVG
jgi:chemotaxis protein MotA